MQTIKRLLTDEQGGEVVEYALIAGMVVVAAVAVIAAIGGKALARWTSVDSSLSPGSVEIMPASRP